MSEIKTSIIVPAFNEEKAIEKVIADLKVYLEQECEIIVVNDGSFDQTKEILKRIPDIKIVEHSENRGYGAALKSGIKNSRGEYILIIDADGTYPIKSIRELIAQKEDYDMVVGARINPTRHIPFMRRPAKWALNRLAGYLTGVKIPDVNSGLRIIKKDVLNRFIHLLPDGFSFTTTITLALLTNNFQVKYLPINYYKRKGKSKIRPIRDTLYFFKLIIKVTLYFNPFKVFFPLSVIIFIAAIIVGVVSILFAQRLADTTFTILCATALQTFFFGLIAELIIRTKPR